MFNDHHFVLKCALSVILAFFLGLNTGFTMPVNEVAIHRTISLKLAPTERAVPMEVLYLQRKMTVEIAKAAYGNALDIAISGLEISKELFIANLFCHDSR